VGLRLYHGHSFLSDGPFRIALTGGLSLPLLVQRFPEPDDSLLFRQNGIRSHSGNQASNVTTLLTPTTIVDSDFATILSNTRFLKYFWGGVKLNHDYFKMSKLFITTFILF
jgi:hypothetical protein